MVPLLWEYVFFSGSVRRELPKGGWSGRSESTGHILGATLKRTGALFPDFSWGFHCFQVSDGFSEGDGIRLSLWKIRLGRNRTNV